MIYVLNKVSSPGWEFTTTHEEAVLDMMEYCVCSYCMVTESEAASLDDYQAGAFSFPDNYDQMSFEEKMSELLWTACGCEYSYNTFEDYLSYHRSEVADWEAMKCVK